MCVRSEVSNMKLLKPLNAFASRLTPDASPGITE